MRDENTNTEATVAAPSFDRALWLVRELERCAVELRVHHESDPQRWARIADKQARVLEEISEALTGSGRWSEFDLPALARKTCERAERADKPNTEARAALTEIGNTLCGLCGWATWGDVVKAALDRHQRVTEAEKRAEIADAAASRLSALLGESQRERLNAPSTAVVDALNAQITGLTHMLARERKRAARYCERLDQISKLLGGLDFLRKHPGIVEKVRALIDDRAEQVKISRELFDGAKHEQQRALAAERELHTAKQRITELQLEVGTLRAEAERLRVVNADFEADASPVNDGRACGCYYDERLVIVECADHARLRLELGDVRRKLGDQQRVLDSYIMAACNARSALGEVLS